MSRVLPGPLLGVFKELLPQRTHRRYGGTPHQHLSLADLHLIAGKAHLSGSQAATGLQIVSPPVKRAGDYPFSHQTLRQRPAVVKTAVVHGPHPVVGAEDADLQIAPVEDRPASVGKVGQSAGRHPGPARLAHTVEVQVDEFCRARSLCTTGNGFPPMPYRSAGISVTNTRTVSRGAPRDWDTASETDSIRSVICSVDLPCTMSIRTSGMSVLFVSGAPVTLPRPARDWKDGVERWSGSSAPVIHRRPHG